MSFNKQFNNLKAIDTFIKKKLTVIFLHVFGNNYKNRIYINANWALNSAFYALVQIRFKKHR